MTKAQRRANKIGNQRRKAAILKLRLAGKAGGIPQDGRFTPRGIKSFLYD